MKFYLYLNTEDVDLKNEATFSYDNSMQRTNRIKDKVSLGDSGFLYMCEEKHGADDTVSWKTVLVEIMEDGDEKSSKNICLDYSMDAEVEEDLCSLRR